MKTLTTRFAVLTACAMTLAACPKGQVKDDAPPKDDKPPVEAPKELDESHLDRTKLPEPAPAKRWAPPAVETWDLNNGMKVWHLKQDQAPLVTMMVMLPNGAATDPNGKHGLTALTVDMVDEGAGKRSALEIADALQRLATDMSSSTETDMVTFGMHMLADKVDASLAILADVLRRPTFPAAEFERRKAQRLQSLLAREADPGTGRGNVLRHVLAGGGYGGWAADGTRASVETLKLADVKAQYKRLFKPAGMQIVVVGDIDKDALTAALTKAFGDWKGKPKAKAAKVVMKPLAKGIHLVDYPDSAQSAIAVAQRAAAFKQSDYFKDLVGNRVLGGAFVSRINMNLREDKGYTYGARSAFIRRRKSGMFLVYANVKADTTAASLLEIEKEIDAIAGGTRPISKEEFMAARGGLLFGFPGRFERMENTAQELAVMPEYDLAPDWLAKWPREVNAVDILGAQRSLDALLHTRLGAAKGQKIRDQVWDAFVIVVAGPRAKIEESLKGLELPIHYYDAQGNPLKEQ